MASRRNPTVARGRPRSSASRVNKKPPSSKRKDISQQVRRSSRLQNLPPPESGEIRRKGSESVPSTAGIISAAQATSKKPTKPPLKRKRGDDVEQSSLLTRAPIPPKRRRIIPHTTAARQPEEVEKCVHAGVTDPLTNWVLNKKWPHECFEQDDQAREDFFDHDSWLEEYMEQAPPPAVQYVEINGFRYPRPIQKAPASLRRKQSDSSLTGSSDQKKRENKSAPYRDARYTTLLAAKGSFLRDPGDDEPPKTVTEPGQTLLNNEQTVPQNSLFRDDLFRRFCREIEDRNEAMIIQDVSRLLVPSAKNLAIYGDRHLDILIENVNEAWTGSIPVEGPRPQPDYSVGFGRSAFTEEQLKKLNPLIGSVFDTSFFVATYRMYFPFFTCEVKCGAAALDIADRQNAHSMTIAVRAVVELYKAVDREKELNREILAFSISHDHRSVRIYGHYPVIDGDKITFYRHPIHEFSFVALAGKDKWTAYKFTKNIYDVWMPTHLTRICSAIDQLPSSLDFHVSQEPGVQPTEATGLSQNMGSLFSESSNAGTASQIAQEDDELIAILPQITTPDTSVSRGDQEATKRVKRGRAPKK